MIEKNCCRLYDKISNYNRIRIFIYKSGRIKTHWNKINKKSKYKSTKKYYAESHKILTNLKTNGCALCGYNKCNEVLHFHHTNPQDKKFPINMMGMRYNNNSFIVEELNKCILLCANCHGEIHHKERKK